MDPQIVANTLYFLKKVSSTALHLNDEIPFFTLGALSNRLLRETFDVEKQKGDVQIFFHMEEISARSNYLFMGKLEVTAASSEISKNLYYLANGFSDKYEYINDDQDNCIYYAPNGRIWGISAESSICLIKDINVDAATKKQFKDLNWNTLFCFHYYYFRNTHIFIS